MARRRRDEVTSVTMHHSEYTIEYGLWRSVCRSELQPSGCTSHGSAKLRARVCLNSPPAKLRKHDLQPLPAPCPCPDPPQHANIPPPRRDPDRAFINPHPLQHVHSAVHWRQRGKPAASNAVNVFRAMKPKSNGQRRRLSAASEEVLRQNRPTHCGILS